MGRFDGSVALVTGASRGIGLGIAERLVDEGAKVVRHRPQAGGARRGGRRSSAAPSTRWAWPASADDVEHQARDRRAHVETFGSARPAGQQHRHQPGVRTDDRARPRRCPQDRRGQLHRRALVGAAGACGAGWASTAAPSSTSPRSPGSARARHRLLRRQQGDADPPHPGAGGRARPDDPGQRGRPRRGEDGSSPRALYEGREERGRRGVPAQAPRRARGRRPAPSPSCCPPTPPGSPGRPLVLDGGVTLTGGV